MSEENEIPKTIGKFQIEAILGEGGFAKVYRAVDEKMDRLVALKVLKEWATFDDKLRQGFINEAKTIDKLKHKNIISIYSLETEHTPYIVMDYAREGDLSKYRGKGLQLEFDQLRSIISQIAEALMYAHKNGVIHRDIKPSNILLAEKNVIKLADFGIARTLQETQTRKNSTLVSGTTVYMAPEQATSGKTTIQVDIYAFGVVIYELFTGYLPFTKRDHADNIDQKRREKPQKFPAKIPISIQNTIFKALEPDPLRRYRTIDDFQGDLIKALYEWERETQDREGFSEYMGRAFVAIDQENWYEARKNLLQAQKFSSAKTVQSTLNTVDIEITRKEAWENANKNLENKHWQDAIEALEIIKKTNPDNPHAIEEKLREANYQLDLRNVYDEGQKAEKEENYIQAIRKLEYVVEREPQYDEGNARNILDQVRKTQSQSAVQEIKLEMAISLAEKNFKRTEELLVELESRAPNGEYGTQSFMQRIQAIKQSLEDGTQSLNQKLVAARLDAKVKGDRATELENELSTVNNALLISHSEKEKLQSRLFTLEDDLGKKLGEYAESLTTITVYLQNFGGNRFIKQIIMKQYDEQITQLRSVVQQIINWGKALSTPPEKKEEEINNEQI